jgi:Fe-S cluster assembly scaffold protein SufB
MSTSTKEDALQRLLASINMHTHNFGEDTAHVEIHGNKVLGSHTVPGLSVEAQEMSNGISVKIRLAAGVEIEKPVYLCFGVLPEEGLQKIEMDVHFEEGARAELIAHCSFPNAMNVTHLMDAKIVLEKNAHYRYFERHVHSPEGGITVVPRAKVSVGEGARFSTEFELIKGRVGSIDIDYEVDCAAYATMEIISRISGRGDDRIKIREAGRLTGEHSKGLLTSHIAVREDAVAEVYNDLRASGAYATGHVDCNEIVQDRASAMAVPVVKVEHPKAHVTHEAAIGSVDSKQLQTLMSRGVSEEHAVEMIIQGIIG